jgi:glycosyltransferase involved in cell wall biosynthesis
MNIIFTLAYNSEKTIHRAIESVLAQSDENWTYYILDNGSTDNTGKIIDTFAASNKRIIPLKNQVNKRRQLLYYLPTLLKKHEGDGFFYCVDADDEYTPDFFQKMIAFINENRLDVASCGTDWINAGTGEIIKHKVPDHNLILEDYDFAVQYPVYRNFMVTVWGVVYSLDLLRNCNFEWANQISYFSDTAFCMAAFRRAKRAGVLAESLHKYYILPTTVSNKYNPDWFLESQKLLAISREYLIDYGEISKQNEDYLYVLHLTLIKYILPRIMNAGVDLREKLERLLEIFSDDTTQYMLEHWSEVGIYSDKREFLCEIREWIISQNGMEASQAVEDLLISVMNNY